MLLKSIFKKKEGKTCRSTSVPIAAWFAKRATFAKNAIAPDAFPPMAIPFTEAAPSPSAASKKRTPTAANAQAFPANFLSNTHAILCTAIHRLVQESNILKS